MPFELQLQPHALLLFALAGGVMGSVGGGGSLLALPIFLLVLKTPMELAVPATTAVVGFAAMFGALNAWRKDRLDLDMLWRFAIPGMAAAAIGALASPKVPTLLLQIGFLAIVTVSGFRMLAFGSTPKASSSDQQASTWGLVSAGAVTGALMGLLGVGGGFLAVPALVLSGRVGARSAVPISLGAMALNAGASLAIQIPSGHFRFSLAAPALMAVLAGMAIGGRASRHMSDRGLERILGAILLAVAVWIAWSRILESLPPS